jgi:site-specific recombinase XerD
MNYASRNLLFFAKRSKPCANGQIPIFARLTIDGKRLEFSLNLSLPPKIWDGRKGRAIGSGSTARTVNDQLAGLESSFYFQCKEIREAGRTMTVEAVRDRLLGKEGQQATLLQIFHEHNRDMRERTGIDFAKLTIQRYEAALTHIERFLSIVYNAKDMNLNDIDHLFLTRFEHYLKVKGSCQHNTVMKHMKSLKKIIGIALANDQMRKNPFLKYRITIKKVEKDYLTEEELLKLAHKELTLPRIAIIRDLFVFQCYTGLAYSDLKDLTINNIKLHHGGMPWIMTERTKTGIPCNIPLLQPAKLILDRYLTHECRKKGVLLPVPSNQKMNAYLKEIADLCGIQKDLTTHMARHTFATTVTLSNDISLESVSRMLGHRKLQTTQIYARILDTKVHREMSRLKDCFPVENG